MVVVVILPLSVLLEAESDTQPKYGHPEAEGWAERETVVAGTGVVVVGMVGVGVIAGLVALVIAVRASTVSVALVYVVPTRGVVFVAVVAP